MRRPEEPIGLAVRGKESKAAATGRIARYLEFLPLIGGNPCGDPDLVT